ncbi:hypothetical protein SAMN05443247_00081 [Bradyrhizobium erythrophlei]|nr:hypothetical protein SAMN05443247_00081 [Bradyrhizobium erythrophlei]
MRGFFYFGYPDYRVDLRPAPHFGTPVIVIGPDKTVIIVGGGTREACLMVL